MFTVYSAGVDKHDNTVHIFLGNKQNILKAQHDETSLCDVSNFKNVNLVMGCVAIGINEMTRKIKLIKAVKCKKCKDMLEEIKVTIH